MQSSTRLAVIVEDDRPTRAFLLKLMRAKGFLAVAFDNAEEALSWLAKQQAPHIISVDLGLPGMSGTSFCTAARRLPHLERVPIIVASSDADERAIAHLQCDAVIKKPFSGEDFLALVARVVA